MEDYKYYPSDIIFRTGFNFLLHHALNHLEISSIEGHCGWDFQPKMFFLERDINYSYREFKIE
jgi:hypothetical protein